MFKSQIFLATVVFFMVIKMPLLAHAGDFEADQPSSSSDNTDSSFDPFSDYTEFEEGGDEEADTNFFRNGRFFSIGIMAGYESFTDVLGQMYKPDFAYGISLTYFFDLKFGFQIGFLTSGHGVNIVDGRTSTTYTGKVSLQHFEFDAKYYFNTQNVTKGLGAFNPYLITGFSTYSRVQSFTGFGGTAQDSEFGFQAGAGVEIPFMRNKMYFGLQGLYNYVAFPDRGAPISIGGVPTNIYPNGDALTLLGLLGFNF